MPSEIMEKHMRLGVILGMMALFVGGSTVLAHAQAALGLAAAPGRNAVPAPVVNRGGGVAGTGIGFGAGAIGQHTPLVVGTGHVGAGTSGIGQGIGNTTGGVNGTTRAGAGGLADTTSWGSSTGGVNGVGRGLGAGSGGMRDQIELGLDTGGINGTGIGSGVGGINDLNSLGAGTGGTKEQTAPRFRVQ
ncbi:MAG TPA: hypothetical protein VLZ74_03090 [Methylocella sp.]|nr:hypothetical protein [Methylocella sp.]